MKQHIIVMNFPDNDTLKVQGEFGDSGTLEWVHGYGFTLNDRQFRELMGDHRETLERQAKEKIDREREDACQKEAERKFREYRERRKLSVW